VPTSGLVPSDSLFPVLSMLRTNGPTTRSELARHTGLTRKVVVQRVEELIDGGLAEEGDMGRSTGGRAPREIRFRTQGASILVTEIAAGSLTVGLTDLAGSLLSSAHVDSDTAAGPDAILARIEQLFDKLLEERPAASPPLYGIGIGVPAPVGIGTGRPIGDLRFPEWVDHPIRDRFATRYNVPVWVENNANLMAIGELRAGLARGHSDAVFIRVGTGIGCAIITSGELQRGSQGFGGEFGHVLVDAGSSETCWCGLTGCLTQIAGAGALGRDGDRAATDGTSPILAAIKAQGRTIAAREVFTAATAGDPTSIRILTGAGRHLGAVTAVLVSALNPSLILLGADHLRPEDPYVAAFRETVLERTLPSATRELQFAISRLGNSAGLIGAAYMVVDGLLSPQTLKLWSESGTPAGLADLIHESSTDAA